MPKVSVVRVTGRDRDHVAAGVRQAVTTAGGFADLIHELRPGQGLLDCQERIGRKEVEFKARFLHPGRPVTMTSGRHGGKRHLGQERGP